MERSFAALMLLVAGIAVSLSAGAWWMQRVAFTPAPTRDTAAAILSSPDIRLEINTVVTAATAQYLETGVSELGTFVETEVLSTRPGAAMMGPIMEQTHDRIIGNRDDEPVRITGAQMVDIVRDQRAVQAPTITLPISPIGALNTIKVALRWTILGAAGLGLIALVIGIITRPERRDVRRALGEFAVAMAVAMLVFGYLLPVHLVTAIDNRTWSHAIPNLALRTLPVVLGSVAIFGVAGAGLIMRASLAGRRRQSSTPLATNRFRSGETRSWS